MVLAAALVALLGLSPAVASVPESSDPATEAPWYVGMPVGLVSLVAADGGLPPEQLEPLLRVRQGRPLNPGDIREDIGLLYRAASFAAVEAEVERWIATTDDGETVDGVHVVYRVVPPATVSRVEVDGPAGPARRLARRSLGVHRDDPIFKDDDLPRLTARVKGALADAGWADAQVTLRTVPDGERREELIMEVVPGEPRRYGEINVLGDIVGPRSPRCMVRDVGARFFRGVDRRPDCGVSARRVRRWLRRSGVREGGRVETGQLEDALVEVRRKLVRRGWLQSRIGFHVGAAAEEGGGLSRTINVEGGPRLILAVDRKRSFRERLLPTAGQLQDTLGFYGGERMDDLTIEEATTRLETYFDTDGYIAAAVELEAEEVDGGTRLNIVVDPGRRHRLGRNRIEVAGTETFTPAFVAGAMREASFETLGENKVSRTGISRSLDAVEDVYRGAGHLEARATFEGLTAPRSFEPIFLRRRRPVRTGVRVKIHEGPRTTLETLEIDDPAGLAHTKVAEAVNRLQGQPYSPGELDLLERTLTGYYQSLGYLNATTDLEVDVDPDQHVARARLHVSPGAQVRLRSVVVRGNRRTRRRVVTRELSLEIGEPITPQAIADSRSALYDLGLFRVVSPELVGDDDRTRDLIIQVDERKNILVEGGGRVATDQGVVATARANHRNIAGLGHNLSLTGQLGYGWLGDEWRIDTQAPVWRVATRYTAPWVPGKGHELIVEGLLREVAQEPTFRIQRSGVRLGIRSKFGGKVETFVDYNAQVRKLEDLDPGALVPGDPWLPFLDLNPDDASGELSVPSDNRVQTGPELLFIVDGRNDRFNPTQGAYLSMQGQLVDRLQSDTIMFRGDLRLETFTGVGPLVVNWYGRVAGGRAAGTGNTLPIEDRYYLGGAGSMRGFRLNQVGPANFSARPNLNMPSALEPAVEGKALRNQAGHWVWTGGDSLFQTTLELRIPLSVLLEDWDTTNIFLFSDVGQVQMLDDAIVTSSDQMGLNRPYRYGVGGGVRVATPIGPAAIAIGVNPSPITDWEEPTVLPHITLGEL